MSFYLICKFWKSVANCWPFRFHHNRDDVSKHLDTTQGELDSLKELLQADGDYSLDVNALFGVSKSIVFSFALLCLGKSFQFRNVDRILLAPPYD